MGDTTRTCRGTGLWSGVEPTCTGTSDAISQVVIQLSISAAVDCGSLADPANGDVSLSSGTTFNSVATYSCSDGYNLVDGDMMRTCLASGSWSGTPSNCTGFKIFMTIMHRKWQCIILFSRSCKLW